jgi:hypothetical protein
MHILMSSPMETRPEGDPQQTAQCLCECGRKYTGETGRLKAQFDYEEGHKVRWDRNGK